MIYSKKIPLKNNLKSNTGIYSALTYTLLAFLTFSLLSCNSNKKIEFKSTEDKKDAPKILFAEPKHDFGQINEGEVVSHTYKFKNIGSMPLQIIDVNVSCGCTVAEKPEQPVGVGKEGEIKVSFNSSGKVGVNTKVVTIISNASNNSESVSFDVIVNKQNQ
jgi:Protein of unknown function (DUF1573)